MSDRRMIFTEAERRHRANQWAKAMLGGNKRAAAWCHENGMITKAQAENVNTAGGNVVGAELADQIIALRETYGVFRRNAQLAPMARDLMSIARRTAGVTGQFTGEGQTITESTANAYDQVDLVCKKYTALIKVSTELFEDSSPDLAAYLAQDCAQAFAKIEDDCGWNGDGTSTYARMSGITQILVDGNHNAGKVAAASTHKTFLTLDSTDIGNLMAALPAYAWPGSKIYCSAFAWATCFLRLAGSSGAVVGTYNGSPTYMGRPVVFSQSLPATSADNSTKIMVVFGDLSLSSILGSTRDLVMAASTQRYLEFDQVGIRATQRFDVVNHSLGDNVTPGAVVGLQGTT